MKYASSNYFFLHPYFPFQLWLVLYVITPVLIPVIWLCNRRQDPHTLTAGDKRVPQISPQIMGLLGLAFTLFAVAGFLFPNWLIRIWVWPLNNQNLSGPMLPIRLVRLQS